MYDIEYNVALIKWMIIVMERGGCRHGGFQVAELRKVGSWTNNPSLYIVKLLYLTCNMRGMEGSKEKKTI